MLDDPAVINSLSLDQFKESPLFGIDENFGDLFDPVLGSEYTKNNRERSLAEAIPALTLPVGGPGGVELYNQKIFDERHTINMEDGLKNGWPEERLNIQRKEWRHNDFEDVSYLYTFPFYRLLTEGRNQ